MIETTASRFTFVRVSDLTWVVSSVIFALLRRGRSDTILTKVRGASSASLASPAATQPARHVRLQDTATGGASAARCTRPDDEDVCSSTFRSYLGDPPPSRWRNGLRTRAKAAPTWHKPGFRRSVAGSVTGHRSAHGNELASRGRSCGSAEFS